MLSPEHRPQNSPPTNIVPSQVGVDHQGLFRVVVVLQSQVDHGRDRVFHIAGRAEPSPDNRIVRFQDQLRKGVAQQRIVLGVVMKEMYRFR